MNKDSAILFVTVPLSLFINVAIFQYLRFNEKNCANCTEHSEHKVLRVTTYLMFGVIALRVLVLVIMGLSNIDNAVVVGGGIIGLIHFIVLYRYISKMLVPDYKECTDEWQRPLLYYYTRIIAVLYGIVGLALLMGIIAIIVLPFVG